MSYTATVFKTMIASPSDVAPERSVIREVLGEWNVVHADTRKVVLLPVGWETHAVPEMGSPPQALINKQVLQGCDLLVGVFWTRVGTKTDRYASGSVEEIEEHIKTGRPTMLYFSQAPVLLDSVDSDQYSRLREFRDSCRGRGLYESYTDVADFRSKFYRQLQIKLNQDPYFATLDTSSAGDAISELPARPRLSKEAEFLLQETAADGHVIHSADLAILQVRGKNLIDEADPRSRATWLAALDELEREGLLASNGYKRTIFQLTKAGYDLADSLPKEA